jgi:hypothetical protein
VILASFFHVGCGHFVLFKAVETASTQQGVEQKQAWQELGIASITETCWHCLAAVQPARCAAADVLSPLLLLLQEGRPG